MSIFWAVVVFGMLIFFHELGHFILAKMVGVKVLKFSLGFGPKLLGRKIGETEYLLCAIPLGGYVKPLGEEPDEELAEEDKPRAFNFQPVWKRAAIVLAGPVFNLVLAYIIFIVFLVGNFPVAIPQLDSITTSIENVSEDSPAMKAGIEPDDMIATIDGKSIIDWSQMADIFSKSPGKELSLIIRRGDEEVTVKVTPEPVTVQNESGEDMVIGRIGISKKLNVVVIESKSILDVPLKAAEAVWEWWVLTLEVVIKLFTGGVSPKQLGGPLVIVDAAAKAAEVGFFPYFNLVAIISVNLALINLMPVPILDGGHIVFLSIEALIGRPLNDKIIGIANRIGFTLLLMLIAFVLYNDTMKIIVPWVMEKFVPWIQNSSLLN